METKNTSSISQRFGVYYSLNHVNLLVSRESTNQKTAGKPAAMDNCVSISGDLHLAKTLDALKAKEDGQRELMAENRGLKEELYQERNAAQLLLDENTQLKSAQQQLCVEVDKLKHSNEDLKRENVQLKEKLTQSQLGGRGGGGGVVEGSASKGTRSGCPRCVTMDRELAKLKSANDEVREGIKSTYMHEISI